MLKNYLNESVAAICLFSFLPSNGQESTMSISIHQDVRLFLFGDDRGNSSFTPDLLVRLEVDAFKLKKSSIRMYFGAEYSDLNSANFQRFLLGVGYITKFSFLEKFIFGLYVDHGIIFRGKGSFLIKNDPPHQKKMDDETSYMGLSINFETTYPITKKLRLSLLYQAIDRKDLTSRFGTEYNTKGSIFLGVKFAL
jgi:hypothetical protein